MGDQRRSQPRLLQAVQEALQAGRRQEARALLQQALRQNPEEYRLWLWLAGVTSSPQVSLKYIRRAEQLAPDNATVARARAWAEQRLATEALQPQVLPAPAERHQPRPDPKERRARPVSEQETRAPRAQKEKQRRSRRPLAFVAGGVALVIVLLLASAFIWRAGNGNSADRPAAVETAPVIAATEPAATPVSGYFSPKNLAAAGEEGASAGAESGTEAEAEATATPRPLESKVMISSKEGDGPRPTWTMTPTPTPTFTPTPTPIPTFVSGVSAPRLAERPSGVGANERWIDVNLTAQRLVAYEGDTPVYDTLVSSGTYDHPTVTGQFRIWLRFQAQTMDGRRLGYDYYLPNVPYVMYFYQDYALHGTYWHNNFGTPMSHGCVNLPTPAAEWIFNWSTMGTVVNVHY